MCNRALLSEDICALIIHWVGGLQGKSPSDPKQDSSLLLLVLLSSSARYVRRLAQTCLSTRQHVAIIVSSRAELSNHASCSNLSCEQTLHEFRE